VLVLIDRRNMLLKIEKICAHVVRVMHRTGILMLDLSAMTTMS